MSEGIVANGVAEKTPHASEAQHWYTKDGKPCYTIKGVKGERAPTLRDARKMNLYPGVSTIIRLAARPGLAKWWETQLLDTVWNGEWTLGPEGAAFEAWVKEVYELTRSRTEVKRDKGVEIHAALEAAFAHQPYDDRFATIVLSTTDILRQAYPDTVWHPEKTFVCNGGYGGKIDLQGDRAVNGTEEELIIIDFKSTEFDTTKRPADLVYDEHLMQGAAYAMGWNSKYLNRRYASTRVANIYISTSVDGLVCLKEHTPEEVNRGMDMFASLLRYWQVERGYVPE